MCTEHEAVVGVGSNLGSREALLRAARDLLDATDGLSVTAVSPIYETAPVGPAQPRYLNAAFVLRCSLDPDALMQTLHSVERRLGRVRRERWGARTLDLDLLTFNRTRHLSSTVIVPHPELMHRAFALAPLVHLRPDACAPDDTLYRDVLRTLPADVSMQVTDFTADFGRETVDHTADEGFVVYARDRADLFAAAAEALGAIIVDGATVAPIEAVPVVVTVDPDDGHDARMVAWASEVLHHLDAGCFALRRAVVFDDGRNEIHGCLYGEALDEHRHAVRCAVKAITWHALDVAPQHDGTWRAQVVVDL